MSRDAREKFILTASLMAVGQCIQICVTRSEACTLAAQEVSDHVLKELLGEFAEERGLQALALRAFAAPFGGVSPSGTRTRKHGLHARSDESVVADCIDGEQAAVAAFEGTFTWAPPSAMPMEVRVLVLSAYSATLHALTELRRRDRGV